MGCTTKCLKDCSETCHERHIPYPLWSHLPNQCEAGFILCTPQVKFVGGTRWLCSVHGGAWPCPTGNRIGFIPEVLEVLEEA